MATSRRGRQGPGKAHDTTYSAMGALKRVRRGVSASDLPAEIATIESAIEAGAMHPVARERLRRVASVATLSKTRPALAARKAKKNAEAAECLKLIRLVEFVAQGYAMGEDGYGLEDCVRLVYGALISRGELVAAEHVAQHADLVKKAIQAVAHPPTGRRTTTSPPTINGVLHALVNADNFASMSFATIKTVRARR